MTAVLIVASVTAAAVIAAGITGRRQLARIREDADTDVTVAWIRSMRTPADVTHVHGLAHALQEGQR